MNDNKQGRLFILSGPSGAGKDTVRKLLDDQALNLAYSISMTTRAPREGEVNGKDYYFVSKNEFENALENGQLLEYNQYLDQYYGTPLKPVLQLLESGRNVLLEIDVNGARQIFTHPDRPDLTSIFLAPPSLKELKKRLEGRGSEDEKSIEKRIRRAAEEMEFSDLYDFVVVNEIPEQAAREIEAIMQKQPEE